MDKFKTMTSQERIEFWKNEIAEYHASGKSSQEFCAEREIGVSSLLNWRRKLQLTEGDRKSKVSIPVLPPRTQNGKSVPQEVEVGSKVQLEVGSIVFSLTGSMEPSWVAALVVALQGGSGSC